jgi:hypothetical protein
VPIGWDGVGVPGSRWLGFLLPFAQNYGYARNWRGWRRAGSSIDLPKASTPWCRETGRDWLPTLEGAAAGIGAAEFGAGRYALMSLTAVRLHRAIPRAIGVAVIAAPRRRETLQMTDRPATVRFLVRDIGILHVEMMQTDLGGCLVTTPEQTVLDLAHLPNLGVMKDEATAAIRALLPRCDRALMAEIATAQRLRRAFDRVRRMTA